jgi:catechol 2,3-dioxygenase-like lactoylglutathione lyase family enzyme
MSRVQLALNVSDLEASVAFYSHLFATEPHKRRPGYANFAISDPPLKLVLIEVPQADRGAGTAGALNHLGVEVEAAEQVEAQADRLREAGLAAFDEKDTTCCYALQDKVWVHDPAGAPWEIYTVKDDDPANPQPATASLPLLATEAEGAACCTPASSEVPAPAAAATTIRVYEPALCCNTGVCGPDVDEGLVTFTADLGALKDLGIDIERHNLANDPTAFAADETVRAFLQVAGSDGLPLTMVDGVTVMTGHYPAREQLLKFAGVDTDVVPSGITVLDVSDESGSCCGGTSCC